MDFMVGPPGENQDSMRFDDRFLDSLRRVRWSRVPGIAISQFRDAVETTLSPGRASAAGLLLDSQSQMKAFNANEKALTQTKHVKIGEHEQGR
jgi:hypothetical protein